MRTSRHNSGASSRIHRGCRRSPVLTLHEPSKVGWNRHLLEFPRRKQSWWQTFPISTTVPILSVRWAQSASSLPRSLRPTRIEKCHDAFPVPPRHSPDVHSLVADGNKRLHDVLWAYQLLSNHTARSSAQ